VCKSDTDPETDRLSQLGHDAFRWGGLGKTGADIYFALKARDQASVAELAEATGRARATVCRKLKLMESLCMVEHLEKGEWRAIDVELDSVAKALGTAGQSERQHERHVQDRWLQRLFLEPKRARNSPRHRSGSVKRVAAR
jgi:DNA-binding transcriptional regulator GbsR (MarR family)